MESQSFSLAEHDRAILYSYVNVAEGVAEFLGNFCEVVIHNLENMDHSVMHIINGHLSGRQVGASISEVTLSFLNRMMAEPNLNHLYYFAKNKRGETFKSSISAIMGDKGNIIGLLCINMYLSSPISDLVHFMTPSSSNKNKEIVSILYQKGIFNLKDSVVTIADHLGISKNTVYMHIRNMNK